jgi:ferrochelatase
MTSAREAVLLIAHGSVDELEDLPAFLQNIRRGHAAPPELLAEVRRRYEAIGGRSPLNAINRRVAERLEARLGMPVRTANRLFQPYPKEVLAELVAAAPGLARIIIVPLAQHSAGVYGDAAREAAREAALDLEIVAAPNWGRTRELTDAYARAITKTLEEVPPGEQPTLLFTAHSLPKSVIDAGDPYETEFRVSAEAVAARIRELSPGGFVDHAIAFQSQGASPGPGGRPMAWLGPDLRSSLVGLAGRGVRSVVLAPIGFLADHVEIFYDLDIEARGWAEELGITLRRVASLNAGDGLVDALAAVVRSVSGAHDTGGA